MLMGTRTDPVINQGRGYGGTEIGLVWLVTIEDRRDRVGVGMIPGADARSDLGLDQAFRTQQ
jgi:hypothetical protein